MSSPELLAFSPRPGLRRRSRRVLTGLGLLALLAGVLAAPNAAGNVYWFAIMTTVVINALLATSLRTMLLIGRLSLGHVGFMLIGAYTSALITMHLNLSVPFSMVLAGCMSALLAAIVAYPFLRVAGIYFAILTLLFAETVRLITYNWNNVSGGPNGLTGIPGGGELHLPFAGVIDLNRIDRYFCFAALVVAVSLLVLYLLERSDLGWKWRSIRDAETLARSAGIQVTAYKIVNFVIASFFAGVGGALYVHAQRTLDAGATSRFGVMMSMYLVVYLVVGGESIFLGPAVGAALITIVAQWANLAEAYQPIVVGAVAIIMAILMPEGLLGVAARGWSSLHGRVVRSRGRRQEHHAAP